MIDSNLGRIYHRCLEDNREDYKITVISLTYAQL